MLFNAHMCRLSEKQLFRKIVMHNVSQSKYLSSFGSKCNQEIVDFVEKKVIEISSDPKSVAQRLLSKIKSDFGKDLREPADISTSASVCHPSDFRFCGRESSIERAKFLLYLTKHEHLPKGLRPLNLLQASKGTGKSRLIDEIYSSLSRDKTLPSIPIAISFNSVFGVAEEVTTSNEEYDVCGRMFSSYFFQETNPDKVKQLIVDSLPRWEAELRKETVKAQSAAFLSDSEIEHKVAAEAPHITIKSALTAIALDFESKHAPFILEGKHIPRRVCLLVDEISKATDTNRTKIVAALTRVIDEKKDTFSMLMSSLNHHPVLSPAMTHSGRRVNFVESGVLPELESLKIAHEVINASGAQIGNDNNAAAKYFNTILFGHCRSYKFLSVALNSLIDKAKQEGKSNNFDVKQLEESLESFELTDQPGRLIDLSNEELAVGLLFTQLPLKLVNSFNSFLLGSGNLITTTASNVNDHVFVDRMIISMLPLQVRRAARRLKLQDRETDLFSKPTIDRLEEIRDLTSGLDFNGFGNTNTNPTKNNRKGEAAEKLVLQSLLVLTETLAGFAEKFKKDKPNEFGVFGAPFEPDAPVPFTMYGAPRGLVAARGLCDSVFLYQESFDVRPYTVMKLKPIKIPKDEFNLFGQKSVGDDNNFYQFPEKPVVDMLRTELGLESDVKVAEYLCDNKIVLIFENEYQIAFDIVMATRRCSDKKVLFHMIEVTCGRYDYYKKGGKVFDEGEELLKRLKGKAEKRNVLIKCFEENLEANKNQILHIHAVLGKMPDWDIKTFNDKMHSVGAVNTAVLDGAAFLRGLGPLCGTILKYD